MCQVIGRLIDGLLDHFKGSTRALVKYLEQPNENGVTLAEAAHSLGNNSVCGDLVCLGVNVHVTHIPAKRGMILHAAVKVHLCKVYSC